jgi:hypothetical protein
MTDKFEVTHWGSDPEAGNDDCWTGEDFDNFEAAKKAFDTDPTDTSVAYVMLDLGPALGQLMRKAPNFVPTDTEKEDAEWREDIAREEGMLNGIDSYNDWRE